MGMISTYVLDRSGDGVAGTANVGMMGRSRDTPRVRRSDTRLFDGAGSQKKAIRALVLSDPDTEFEPKFVRP
jgi:hypothetical protein